MRSSAIRWAALALLIALTIALVDAAGHSREVPRITRPRSPFPAKFPSHAELAADPRLRELYTGSNQIQVHVVPHTHDDVGWLKTVDQYYLGANNSIQHAAVRYILDTVVEELQKNPARKFIYVEQAFFQMYWSRQSADKQAAIKKLVATGQLEFVNGGWCMHDEAATHYIDMIDQTTLGHQFIKQQFGDSALPTIGWQIDPFGHSATQAALLSGVGGMDGLFFGRIDYQDHAQRMDRRDMEFLWRPSPSLGTQGQVFTGVFQNGNYGPPEGFCWDWFCGDSPIIDDEAMSDYNVPQMLNQFLDEMNTQASYTKGRNIMITMGSDFQYENAREWFDNLDKLIEYVNRDGRINAFYSTPAAYVAAKNAEGIDWSVKTDDFFPYADGPHSYWTGYFTSRAALKRYVRSSSAALQAYRQIESLTGGDGSATMPLSQSLGVAQHHDAVAGTAKQHVAFDYAQRLSRGEHAAQSFVAQALAAMTTHGHPGAESPQFVFCPLANITVCPLSQDSSSFQLLLWNPLARPRTELVRLPVTNTELIVLDSTGAAVKAQVSHVLNVSSHTGESAELTLDFLATVLPLGFTTFFVQPAQKRGAVFHEAVHLPVDTPAAGAKRMKLSRHARLAAGQASTFTTALRHASPLQDAILSNEFLSIRFDGATGEPFSLTDLRTGVEHAFGVRFCWYESWQDDSSQMSGAYIFRPAQQKCHSVAASGMLLHQHGPILSEAQSVVNDWLNLTYRLVAGQNWLEVEYTVGGIPIGDGLGKEVVLQYATDIESKGQWWTDSNGREMIGRQRDSRSSFKLNLTEPIASNFVPVNTAAFIRDSSAQLTLLPDRAQGVASLVDGELEVMLHRRTLCDDARGVGEPLNETAIMTPYPNPQRLGAPLIITGMHRLMLSSNVSAAAADWRPAMSRVYSPLRPVLALLSAGSISAYLSTHNVESSWIGPIGSLPPNVDLISLQSWSQWTGRTGDLLIRLAHQFAVDEDDAGELTQPVSIDLAQLFTQQPTDVRLVSLTATRDARLQQPRFEWSEVQRDADMNVSGDMRHTATLDLRC